MNKFKLTITNQSDEYDLYFDIFDTPIAQKWRNEINKNYRLFEIDRFTNWPNSNKNKDYYIKELNDQIRIINHHHPGTIDLYLTEHSTQDTMNHLHKFFEDLRGPINDRTEWFDNAHRDACKALNRYNILIHEYEHYRFNENTIHLTHHPYATIVGTFKGYRHRLSNEDYDYYTFKWKFGTVYINYCEVGKPLLDVFKDNDDVVGDLNIRPLHYYSADFQIKFGPSTLDTVYADREKRFWDWYEQRKDYFASLGLIKNNQLALGLIPVASLNLHDSTLEGLSQLEIVLKLSKYNQIKSVCIQ